MFKTNSFGFLSCIYPFKKTNKCLVTVIDRSESNIAIFGQPCVCECVVVFLGSEHVSLIVL